MLTFFFFLSFFFFFSSSSLSFMVISMILFSISVFVSFWYYLGMTWMVFIFSLLFLGGILVVFMVVSSLFPNSKDFSYSFNKKIFLLFSLFFFFFFFFDLEILDYKWFLCSGGNFFFLIFLILGYFFSFVYFVSKDKLTLRSFF